MKQTTMTGKTKPPPKTPKKGVSFNVSHGVRYGLIPGTRHPKTGTIESVICRFCLVFGREAALDELAERPRKKTTNNKHFNTFRTDLYDKHLRTQHPFRWASYQQLDAESKEAFFSTPQVPYRNTLNAVFETDTAVRFSVRASIIDTVIGDLLFHPDDADGASHARVMAVFVKETTHYVVEEKNPSRFRLCVKFMGRGASFRMASALMQDVKDETSIGRYGGVSEGVAAKYARLVCAASLERLSQCIDMSWAFSIALDCATHQGSSYVDIRCRFVKGGSLHNFHLIAIPLYERHTAANIFNVVQTFFDAAIPSWRPRLLGVSTDGAATMVGCVGGLVTMLETEAENPVVRVWCGLHQLDLKMQVVFQQALHEAYLSKLTALIGHLRRQQSLISEMRTTCPKVASTRWLSMYQVANWLCTNGYCVRAHLSEKGGAVAPNPVWWIYLYGLREIAREANAVFVSLQGKSTLIQQQHDRFVGLVARLRKMSGAVGPLTESEIEKLSPDKHAINGQFALSHEKTKTYIEGLDLWVFDEFHALREEKRKLVVDAVAKTYVLALSLIYSLTEVQPGAFSPRVTPRELVNSSMHEFAAVIESRRAQLVPFFGDAGVHQLGTEFRELQLDYTRDTAFRKLLDGFDHRLATFNDMWSIGNAVGKYPALANFCGGLASVFPNTATVEADFSVVGCAKTDKRSTMTDLSLEGVLHCKQWQELAVLNPSTVLSNSGDVAV